MAKVWKDHPLFGRIVRFNGADCTVVNVKAGPVLAEIDMGATDFTLRGTIKLQLRYQGGAKVWTAPMEYNEQQPADLGARGGSDDN